MKVKMLVVVAEEEEVELKWEEVEEVEELVKELLEAKGKVLVKVKLAKEESGAGWTDARRKAAAKRAAAMCAPRRQGKIPPRLLQAPSSLRHSCQPSLPTIRSLLFPQVWQSLSLALLSYFLLPRTDVFNCWQARIQDSTTGGARPNFRRRGGHT